MIIINQDISVRPGNTKEAEKYLEVRKDILSEIEMGKMFIENKLSMIRSNLDNHLYNFFLVKIASRTVGYGRIFQGEFPSNGHVGKIGIGLLKKYRQDDIKRKLLIGIEGFALQNNLKRLDQYVSLYDYEDVQLSINLGYKIEGRMKNANFLDGKYFDSYIMAKMI